jgi:hypothetical protein
LCKISDVGCRWCTYGKCVDVIVNLPRLLISDTSNAAKFAMWVDSLGHVRKTVALVLVDLLSRSLSREELKMELGFKDWVVGGCI